MIKNQRQPNFADWTIEITSKSKKIHKYLSNLELGGVKVQQ